MMKKMTITKMMKKKLVNEEEGDDHEHNEKEAGE